MLKKIPNSTISTILTRYKISNEAKVLLTTNMTPEQALDCLLKAEQFNDAIIFIAHALPLIEAIAWGCEALKLRQDQWSHEQLLAINITLSWLQNPNETNRIRANQLAERIDLKTAPAWIAKAVYWSGTGSIIAPELPSVMPPPYLYSHAVAATITIAAALPAWLKNDMGYQAFYKNVIHQGIEIAQGKTLSLNLVKITKEN